MQTTTTLDANQLVTVQLTVAELRLIRKALLSIEDTGDAQHDKASNNAYVTVTDALRSAK